MNGKSDFTVKVGPELALDRIQVDATATVQLAGGTTAPVLIVRIMEAGVTGSAGVLGGAIVTRMGRDRLRARSSAAWPRERARPR